MLIQNDAPWIEYLEIDEETGKRTLRKDTPKEICEKYENYLTQYEKNMARPK